MLQFSKTEHFDIISIAFICQPNLAEDNRCVRVLLMVAIMKLLLVRSRVARAETWVNILSYFTQNLRLKAVLLVIEFEIW